MAPETADVLILCVAWFLATGYAVVGTAFTIVIADKVLRERSGHHR